MGYKERKVCVEYGRECIYNPRCKKGSGNMIDRKVKHGKKKTRCIDYRIKEIEKGIIPH